MNILFVTPRIPYPPDTGAKIRTLNLLKQAKAGGNDVTLLSFVYGDEDKIHVGALQNMGIEVETVKGKDLIDFSAVVRAVSERLPVSIAKYYTADMFSALNDLLRKNGIDLVHFDHIHMGQYVDICDGTPSIIDEHNVESVILKRLCKKEKNIFKKAILKNEYIKMEKLEKEKCAQASKVLVVSDEDRRGLKELCINGFDAAVVPNGVDTEYFKSPSHSLDLARDKHVTRSPEENSVVFTGSMDWLPNIDAVEYFCRGVLPLVWKEKRELRFYVVGKNPSKRVIELDKRDKRIIVTGKVEDVRPYIEKAKAFVAPLRIGGGTRLKILEALAMEKAVVSTSIGAEGLNVRDGEHLLIADAPSDIARKIIMLLDNEGMRRQLGKKGRELVEKEYDWRTIGDKLNEVYKKVISKNGKK